MYVRRVPVTFQPRESFPDLTLLLSQATDLLSLFPFPSAFYSMTSLGGDYVTPRPWNEGTEDERYFSLMIWWSMKEPTLFPLKTSYATAREDQVDTPIDSRPRSQISLSMNEKKRQVPDSVDGFYVDRFQLIIGQSRGLTLDRFLSEIYLFPLAPKADPFEAAAIAEEFLTNGDDRLIVSWFERLGATTLTDVKTGLYPAYYLFFLMTRMACYPFSPEQMILAERRSRATPEQKTFIDSVFELELTKERLDTILYLVDDLERGKELFSTVYDKWWRWGDEYIRLLGTEIEQVESLADVSGVIGNKMNSWPDVEIDKLIKTLSFSPPMRAEFPFREDWIQAVAGTIGRYRADLADTFRWIVQTERRSWIPQMTVRPH